MSFHKRFLLWPVLLVLLSGCGYTVSGTSTFSPEVAGKKFAIPVFGNRSYRANAGAVLTESLVDEFARRSGGNVVAPENADLLVTGEVVSYATAAVSYSALDRVKGYRAMLSVEAALKEKSTMKVLWKGRLSFDQDYPVNLDIALQENNEEAALKEICRKISQQLYQKISEGF